MAKNRIAFLTQIPVIQSTPLTSTSGTIFTAGADGAKILGIYISGTPTATSYTVSVDGEQIFSSVAPANGPLTELAHMPTDANGNSYFNVPANAVISATTVGGTAAFVVYGENY